MIKKLSRFAPNINQINFRLLFLILFVLPVIIKLVFPYFAGGDFFLPNFVFTPILILLAELFYYLCLICFGVLIIRKNKFFVTIAENILLSVITVIFIVPSFVISYGTNIELAECTSDKIFKVALIKNENGYTVPKIGVYEHSSLFVYKKVAQWGGSDLKIEVSKDLANFSSIKDIVVCFERLNYGSSAYSVKPEFDNEIFVKSNNF